MKHTVLAAAAALACVCSATGAIAGGVEVQVGYADVLRSSGFFPNPWIDTPGVVSQGSYANDNGAVRFINNTASAVTIDNFSYTINFSGSYSVGGSLTLNPGQSGIYVLGDTSDISYIPGATYGNLASGCAVSCPIVSFTIDGGALLSLNDSGHVLDTGGFDYAANGSNESFAWRDIGTFGGPAGAPEPGVWAMLVLGLGLTGAALRRRASTAVA